MRRLTPVDHPDLLVGTATGDDAAVWRLDDNRSLVVTADFITPVVDDARTWGQVAAANAVSDVYAMGGRPLLALNLVGWNSEELSTELLGDVLLGAQDVADAGGFGPVEFLTTPLVKALHADWGGAAGAEEEYRLFYASAATVGEGMHGD